MTASNSLPQKIYQKITAYFRQFTHWLHILFKRFFSKPSSGTPFKKKNPLEDAALNELLNAINQGDLCLVKKLLNEEKVNIKDIGNSGQLLSACISNKNKKQYSIKYETLECLIKQGVNLEGWIHPYSFLTIWEFAFEWLDLNLINFLLKAGVPVTDGTLNNLASFFQRREFLNKDFGHTKNSMNYTNQFGYTFINKQAAKIFGKILDLFSKTDKFALNPNSHLQVEKLLGYFIRNGYIDVIKRTLDKVDEANLSKTYIYRFTYFTCIPVVRLAVQHNQTEIAKLLINFYNPHRGTDPACNIEIQLAGNAYCEHEILEDSIRSNNLEIFNLLLNNPRLNINWAKDALYFAMTNRNYDMVQLLLDKGASFNEDPYPEDEIADIIAFKTAGKALLCNPQHGLANHLPPVLVSIVGDYLIPDNAPRELSTP